MKFFILVTATTALLASSGLHAEDHKSNDKHWQVHGAGDGGPTMRAKASQDSAKLISHVPNGTYVKRAGDCKKRDGHNWCEVEHEGKRGWIREKFLRKPKDD